MPAMFRFALMFWLAPFAAAAADDAPRVTVAGVGAADLGGTVASGPATAVALELVAGDAPAAFRLDGDILSADGAGGLVGVVLADLSEGVRAELVGFLARGEGQMLGGDWRLSPADGPPGHVEIGLIGGAFGMVVGRNFYLGIRQGPEFRIGQGSLVAIRHEDPAWQKKPGLGGAIKAVPINRVQLVPAGP